jgi:hypothetical protein
VSDQHYRRTRSVVRVGGLRLGRWALGGHRYSVGPLSLADASALLSVLSQLAGLWPKDVAGAMSFARAAPIAVLRPVVPLLVEGRVVRGAVKPGALLERDRKRMSPRQVLLLFEAAMKANDLDFIFAGFAPKEGGGERLPLERIIDRFVLRYGCYTHADAWAMPVQEFLAIVETWRKEAEEASGESEGKAEEASVPLTAEDIARLRFLGLN